MDTPVQDSKATDQLKPTIKSVDMSADLQQAVVNIALEAMRKYDVEKDIATMIKMELDAKFNQTWHCVVGKSFGSYVTHESKHFIYFYVGELALLVYKTAP